MGKEFVEQYETQIQNLSHKIQLASQLLQT